MAHIIQTHHTPQPHRFQAVVSLASELPHQWDGATVVQCWVQLMAAYHSGHLEEVCVGGGVRESVLVLVLVLVCDSLGGGV